MATNNYDNLQFIKKETLNSMADAIRTLKDYSSDTKFTATEMKDEVASIQKPNMPKPVIELNEDTGIVTATETLETTGYYKADTSSSNTLELPTKNGVQVSPEHDSQTIKVTGKYMTDNIYVDGSDDLHSENILANKTIFGVPGTHVCDELPAGQVNSRITYDGQGTDIKANIAVVTQSGEEAQMVGVATGDRYTTIKASELDNDLAAGNIKKDVEIFGVRGTFTEVTNGTAVEASDIRSGKTAFVNGKQVDGAMPDTALTVSAEASAETIVAPGDITISSKYTSVDGKTKLTATPTTDTNEIDTYYIAVTATAAANSNGATSYISGTATASIDKAGYIASGTTGSVTGTATAKTSKKSSSTYYIPIKSGSCTVHGGGLTVDSNYSGTPTVDITLDGQTTSGATITDTQPTSGYYLTVGATSSKLTGATKVTRGDITSIHKLGYIPTKTTADGVDIKSTSASPSVTVNSGSKTEYIKIPTASGSIGGSASYGKATAAISNVNNMNTISSPTGTGGTDYFTVKATASGTAGGYTPKYTVDTEGYIASNVTGTKQTVPVSSDTTGQSIHIPKASVSVGGTASSGSATALINNVNSMNTVSYPAGTAGTDYFTVTATAYGTNGGFTPSMSVDTEGYLKSGAEGSYTLVQVDSDTTGQSIHIPKASLSASDSSVSVSNSVIPGSFSLEQVARPNVNGKQIIRVGTPTTETSEVTTNYYVAIRPSVAEGTSGISDACSVTASVNSAGYAPKGLSSTGNVSISGTLTSEAKTGDTFFLPIPGCKIRNDMSGFSSCYKLKSEYSGGSVIPIYLEVTEGGWLRQGDFWLYDESSIDVKYMDSQYTGLKPEYIAKGHSIFGVEGTYTGNDPFSNTINVAYQGTNRTYSGQIGYGIEDGFIEDTYVATFSIASSTEGFFEVKGVDHGITRLVIKYYTNIGRTATAFAYYTVSCSAF